MTDDFAELRADVANYTDIGRTHMDDVPVDALRRLLDAADKYELATDAAESIRKQRNAWIDTARLMQELYSELAFLRARAERLEVVAKKLVDAFDRHQITNTGDFDVTAWLVDHARAALTEQEPPK